MVEGEGAAEKIFSQGYKYTFGTLSPAPNYLKGVVEMAAAQNPKPKTVVILSANDAFSVEVADGAKKAAEAAGLTVAAYIKYPDKETNLTAQVTQAKGQTPTCCSTAATSPRRSPSSRPRRNWALNPHGRRLQRRPVAARLQGHAQGRRRLRVRRLAVDQGPELQRRRLLEDAASLL